MKTKNLYSSPFVKIVAVTTLTTLMTSDTIGGSTDGYEGDDATEGYGVEAGSYN